MYRKFKPLNIPDGWEQYWSKYPNGYSILEALIDWVSQVDDMVENQNELTDTVKSFGERIDEFINQFGTELQQTVTDTLSDWQDSGFLDVVISEALQWELDDFKATTEQNFLSVNQQLQQIALDVKQVGAKGDGVTDDTLAIQQALDSASTVLITQGTYMIDATRVTIPNYGDNTVGGLFPKSNQKIIFEKGAVLKVIPNDKEWYSVFALHEVENVEIVDGIVIGDRNEHIGISGEWGYGYNVMSSKQITLTKCQASDFWGDGFLIGCTNHTDGATLSENVTLNNCVSSNNRRQGASVVGGRNILIKGGRYTGTNGTEPASGIDLEPNHLNTINENITLDGVDLRDNDYYGLMTTSNKNVRVIGCIFSGNGRSSYYVTAENDVVFENCVFHNENVLHMQPYLDVLKFITFRNCHIILNGTNILMSATSAPAYSGEINWIGNFIEFTDVTGKTISLYGTADSNFTSKFERNRILMNASLTGSQFTGDDILLISDDNIRVAENEFINKSLTPLRLFYGGTQAKFGNPNKYIGPIRDSEGKVNGDYSNLRLGFGNIDANTSKTYDGVLIPSLKIGDDVIIKPLFNTNGLIIIYSIPENGQLDFHAYNPSNAPVFIDNDVRLDIKSVY